MAKMKKPTEEEVDAHGEVHRRLQHLSLRASQDEVIAALRKVADGLALELRRSNVALVEAARECIDSEGTFGGAKARMSAIDKWKRHAVKTIRNGGM